MFDREQYLQQLDAMPAAENGHASRNGTHKAKPSRWAVLNTFVDTTMAELTGVQVKVWLTIYRDTRDGTAKVSMSNLARRAGCTRRAVVNAVKQLEEKGLLQVVKRGRPNHTASTYQVKGGTE